LLSRRPGRADAKAGRIVRSADFERVLKSRSCGRSAHFAVHHLAERPGHAKHASAMPPKTDLSTGVAPVVTNAVDESVAGAGMAGQRGDELWLGTVVPKRHARRSVTRSLLKRQIRVAFLRHGLALDRGLWVVRLRAPFERASFPSAASTALRRAAADELDALLTRASARPRPAQ